MQGPEIHEISLVGKEKIEAEKIYETGKF